MQSHDMFQTFFHGIDTKQALKILFPSACNSRDSLKLCSTPLLEMVMTYEG